MLTRVAAAMTMASAAAAVSGTTAAGAQGDSPDFDDDHFVPDDHDDLDHDRYDLDDLDDLDKRYDLDDGRHGPRGV